MAEVLILIRDIVLNNEGSLDPSLNFFGFAKPEESPQLSLLSDIFYPSWRITLTYFICPNYCLSQH